MVVVLNSRLRFSLAAREVTSGHVSQHESLSHSSYKGCMWLTCRVLPHFTLMFNAYSTSDWNCEKKKGLIQFMLGRRADADFCQSIARVVKQHIQVGLACLRSTKFAPNIRVDILILPRQVSTHALPGYKNWPVGCVVEITSRLHSAIFGPTYIYHFDHTHIYMHLPPIFHRPQTNAQIKRPLNA